MNRSRSLFSCVSNAVGWVGIPGALALFALMLHTVLNAILRTFVGEPIAGTLEYGGYWYMPMIALLGFGWAQRRNEQIEARLVFDRMPRRVQRDYQVIGHAVILVLCLVFVVAGWAEAVESMEIGRTAGVTEVVVWPTSFLVPIGFALLACHLVFDLVRLGYGRIDQGRARHLSEMQGKNAVETRD